MAATLFINPLRRTSSEAYKLCKCQDARNATNVDNHLFLWGVVHISKMLMTDNQRVGDLLRGQPSSTLYGCPRFPASYTCPTHSGVDNQFWVGRLSKPHTCPVHKNVSIRNIQTWFFFSGSIHIVLLVVVPKLFLRRLTLGDLIPVRVRSYWMNKRMASNDHPL